ncbi:MAG: metallophosphoesterase family protein [Nocardioidaceae bacterium]
MRFVASADWQLGMTAAFLDDDARPRFAQARFDVLARIGRLADERGASFVVVGGDVFESNHLDRKILSRAFEALRQSTVPVYLLPGNHDPLDASSIYTSSEFRRGCPDHVHVLGCPGPHRVEASDGASVEIVAVPWFTKRPLADLVAAALDGLPPADGVTRVLVAHGQVDSLNPDRNDPATIDETTLRRGIDDGRVQFAVLGDRHATYRVDDRIWYPGTPEVTSRRETDPGNVLVVDVDATSVSVEKVRTGEWTFAELSAELVGDDDIAALDERLRERDRKERTAVWLRLSGSLSVQAKAALDDLIDRAAELYAKVEVSERYSDLVVVPDDHDFGDMGLVGASRSAVDELVALARSAAAPGSGRAVSSEAVAAQDALGLLYRLTMGGGR